MGLLSTEIARLNRLEQSRIDRIARKAVTTNQETIIQTLQGQLHEGRVTERDLAAPSYAEETENWAKADPPRDTLYGANQKIGRYNFEWHGYFFESMRIRLSNEDFYIDADPSTTRGLLSLTKMQNRGWSHSQLTELTSDNEKDVVEKLIEPEIYREILDELARIVL